VKTSAIVLVVCAFAGCAYAMPKEKIVGKQVRIPHHRLGVIVGRAEEGFIIMPVKPDMMSVKPDKRQAASARASQIAR
jgi:hypothetical protein